MKWGLIEIKKRVHIHGYAVRRSLESCLDRVVGLDVGDDAVNNENQQRGSCAFRCTHCNALGTTLGCSHYCNQESRKQRQHRKPARHSRLSKVRVPLVKSGTSSSVPMLAMLLAIRLEHQSETELARHLVMRSAHLSEAASGWSWMTWVTLLEMRTVRVWGLRCTNCSVLGTAPGYLHSCN